MSAEKRENPSALYKEHATDLFEAIQKKTIKTKELARAWHSLYNSDTSQAFASIFTLLVNSCAIPIHSPAFEDSLGSKSKFFKYLLKNSKELTSFPLQVLTRGNKIKNFQDFFKHLALLSEDQPEILSKIVNWLIDGSGFSIRTVRQACAWIFSGLLPGLIELLSNYNAKCENLNEASESSARIEGFRKEKKTTKQRVELIEGIIKDVLNNVIAVRFKDVLADVRLVIMQIIEKLVGTEYEANIVEYLGPLSRDNKTEVRIRVLKVLGKLNKEVLKEFKERVFEMCFDLDDKCCVAAIKLCQDPEIELLENEKKKIQDLLWSESKEIRTAATEFLIVSYFGNRLPQGVSDAVGIGLDQCKVLSIEKALLALIHFFNQNSPGLFASEQFVECFWSKTSAIRSCDVMCDLLARGCSERSTSSSLGNAEKIVILSFIESILKFLSNDPKNKNKLVSTSSLLWLKLPELVTYYRNEIEILRHLGKIPLLLDLNALASNDLKRNFLELLQQLSEIFMSVSDLDILKSVVKALVKYSKENHPLKKEAVNEVAKIIEIVTKGNYKQVLQQLSAVLSAKDIVSELNPSLFKACEKQILICPDTVTNLVMFWHMWSFSKVIKGEFGEEDYFLLRTKTIEYFLRVMKETAYHPSSVTALKYLSETLFLISDASSVKGKFFFTIPKELSEDIEKFMIYSYLPECNEEDSKDAENICVSVSRVIVICAQLTNSHLTSSFVAFYGRSTLLRISTVVKQLLHKFKTQDSAKTQAFADEKLFFAIAFQSLTKVICRGAAKDVENMKELCRKLAMFLPNDKNSKGGRFSKFVTEIVDFSFTDPSNFPILEALTIFVSKNTMEIEKIREVYEHVRFYADNFAKEREPLYLVMTHLKRILSIAKGSVVNEESGEEEEEFVAPKSVKSKKSVAESVMSRQSAGESEKKRKKSVAESEKSNKSVTTRKKSGVESDKKKKKSEDESEKEEARTKKRKRENYENERKGVKEPYGRTRKAALRKKVK